MKTKKTIRAPRRPAQLRERAEAWLEQSPRAGSETPGGDVRNLVHELRVHQAELEMQNEELRRVQLELEDSRDRFEQLYDLAPVGYLTLDAAGVIHEANLTAARLLGLDRQALLRKKLSRFVAAASQDDFYLHWRRVFTTTAGKPVCELRMRRPDGSAFSGRLESVVVATAQEQPARCLVALSDVTEHQRAEEALHLSEAHYRSLFELNPCPMWICDETTWEFLDVNEAALRLYGWSRKEFLKMTAKDIRPPEDVPKFLRALDGQHKSRAMFVGEWRHVKRDGSVFDVAVTISSIQYTNRTARLVLVSDITERKRADQALRASEERYRSLFEHDLTGDYVAGSDGKILLCNEAFASIYGFASVKAALGRTLADLQPDPDFWPAFIKRLKKQKRLLRHERAARRRDGRLLHIVETVVGAFDGCGELVQLQGYVFDDTERKRAEAHLRQLNDTLERRVAKRAEELTDANRRLHATMDTALVGILTLDERGSVVELNAAAARIFGYAPEELVGRNVGRLMAGPDQAQHEEFLPHHLQTVEKLFSGARREVLGRRKDGGAIMLEMSVVKFFDGGRRQVVAMLRDITERKRLERELLEITERERQRIGHDLHDGLGQQLHGLSYLAALLEKGLQGEASRHATEASRLTKYLDEALEMTRSLAHGLQPVKPVPEGLVMALRELAERTRGLYRVDCRFECRAPVLIHRHSAANHLFRIAQEAVNNAMKHGKPTRLRLKLAASRQSVILGVRDNGVGIRRPTRPGRGMGLHVMQYRADAISGSLVVQRLPERGTKVVCTVNRSALLPHADNETK